MLFAKKTIKRLFENTDVNIPVTFFQPNVKNDFVKNAWFNIIKESLGQQLLSSKQTYTFQITCTKCSPYIIEASGIEIMEKLRFAFLHDKPTSIRIDILEDSDKSWVIIVANEL